MASYDSVNPVHYGLHQDQAFRPPLAEGLFRAGIEQGKVIESIPEVSPLIPRLRDATSRGVVEPELETIRAEATSYPPHHQQLTAVRFYQQQLLDHCGSAWAKAAYGITNYVDLLYQVDKWAVPRKEKVCIVSFNYDTMLEQAYDLVLGRRMNRIENYVSAGNFPLIKPHGSVDWGIVTKKKWN